MVNVKEINNLTNAPLKSLVKKVLMKTSKKYSFVFGDKITIVDFDLDRVYISRDENPSEDSRADIIIRTWDIRDYGKNKTRFEWTLFYYETPEAEGATDISRGVTILDNTKNIN